MTDRFLACWPYTLAQECPYPNDWSNPANFSDTPGDPGGATMCGIIQSEYNTYLRENGLPIVSVRDITQDQGQSICTNNYWNPHCPNLPIGLDMDFFDSAMNEGQTEAIRILQVALDISDDGMWGPITSAAVAAINGVSNVIRLFTARRIVVYRETSGFGEFGTDWIRRATEIGNESLAMAAAPQLEWYRHVPKARFYLPNYLGE
jgi:lysozyme family protein